MGSPLKWMAPFDLSLSNQPPPQKEKQPGGEGVFLAAALGIHEAGVPVQGPAVEVVQALRVLSGKMRKPAGIVWGGCGTEAF